MILSRFWLPYQDELLLCYGGWETAFLKSSWRDRQRHLFHNWGFSCACPRCEDDSGNSLGETWDKASWCAASLSHSQRVGLRAGVNVGAGRGPLKDMSGTTWWWAWNDWDNIWNMTTWWWQTSSSMWPARRASSEAAASSLSILSTRPAWAHGIDRGGFGRLLSLEIQKPEVLSWKRKKMGVIFAPEVASAFLAEVQ